MSNKIKVLWAKPEVKAGTMLVAMLLVVIWVVSRCDDGDDSSTSSKKSTTTTEVADKVVKKEKPCPSGREVKLANHKGNKVAAAGLTSVESNEVKMQIAAMALTDPAVFALYYNASPLGQQDPIEDPADLVVGDVVEDGVCISVDGATLYDEWLVLWRATSITPVDSMPEGWGNTGVNGTSPTSGAAPTGDTSGVMVVYLDAQGKEIGRHGVMKRCANPVTPAPPPGIPEGPTDETPPGEPPGGKDYGRITPGVRTPVEPEQPRRPPPAEPIPPRPTPTVPATTVVPDVPDNPTCPGGYCPHHPVPTTVAPPVTTPSTSVPPSTPLPTVPPSN